MLHAYDSVAGWAVDFVDEHPEGRPPDAAELEAVDALRAYFDANMERVFSQRQVEVEFEGRYFHWITQRALKVLAEEGAIVLEKRTLSHGAPINFVWHRSNRYTRRQKRRNTREFGDRKWIESAHDLDFLFERDGRVYGVEVKNTLPYIHDRELDTKVRLCAHLRVIPVFVVRAMPRTWVVEVARRGGFTLVLRHQLYPLSHKSLALEVRSTLGLPVDAPRALYDGTMQRFVNWHDARRSIGRGEDEAGA